MGRPSRFEITLEWLNQAPRIDGWELYMWANGDKDVIGLAYMPGPDNPCDPVEGEIEMRTVAIEGVDAGLALVRELAQKARELYDGIDL